MNVIWMLFEIFMEKRCYCLAIFIPRRGYAAHDESQQLFSSARERDGSCSIYIVIVPVKIMRECGSWRVANSHSRRRDGGSWRDHRPGYFTAWSWRESRGHRVNKRNCELELIETPSRCVRARTSIRSAILGFSSLAVETLNSESRRHFVIVQSG